jgi:hypothetical protein
MATDTVEEQTALKAEILPERWKQYISQNIGAHLPNYMVSTTTIL